MIITSEAWAWGFADGAHGKSIYDGYLLFAGYSLAEYQRGHAAGRAAVDTYVPFQCPELYSDVLPAYQREDHVGD